MAQHKWHKEIKYWADGGEIEARSYYQKTKQWTKWHYEDKPDWYLSDVFEYRIKPQPKEPQYLYVYESVVGVNSFTTENIFMPTNVYHKYIGKIKLELDSD